MQIRAVLLRPHYLFNIRFFSKGVLRATWGMFDSAIKMRLDVLLQIKIKFYPNKFYSFCTLLLHQVSFEIQFLGKISSHSGYGKT